MKTGSVSNDHFRVIYHSLIISWRSKIILEKNKKKKKKTAGQQSATEKSSPSKVVAALPDAYSSSLSASAATVGEDVGVFGNREDIAEVGQFDAG